ncbi:hypothetical protein D3C83_172450 [compost metagenome]
MPSPTEPVFTPANPMRTVPGVFAPTSAVEAVDDAAVFRLKPNADGLDAVPFDVVLP